jgi:hypothetical protein
MQKQVTLTGKEWPVQLKLVDGKLWLGAGRKSAKLTTAKAKSLHKWLGSVLGE